MVWVYFLSCQRFSTCGHVLCGTDLGKTEIENLGVSPLSDKDVCGLDVAVDDFLGVSGFEGIGDFHGNIQQRLEFHRTAPDEVLERRTVEKLHGDETLAVVLADFVNGANVGMIQRGSSASLTAETLEGLSVAHELIGEELESDEAAELGVLGLVNHTHPATT